MIYQQHTKYWIWLIVSVISSTTAIAEDQLSSSSESSAQEYVGCFELGFEADFFFPKGGKLNEVWALNLESYPEEFIEEINAFPPDKHGYRHVFARVLAHTVYRSKEIYARAISVHRVIELRNHQKSDGICNLVPPPQ